MWSTSSFKWQSETILKLFFSLSAAWWSQGSSDNCYYIMSCSVCFDTLQWCLLVNIFPPPPPWSRYCISLTLWLSTLCSAPHLESVPSALLRCHVISHCELAITLKLFKLNRPCFRIHLWGPKNERSWLLTKPASVSCLLNYPWLMFFSPYHVIFSGSENCSAL